MKYFEPQPETTLQSTPWSVSRDLRVATVTFPPHGKCQVLKEAVVTGYSRRVMVCMIVRCV